MLFEKYCCAVYNDIQLVLYRPANGSVLLLAQTIFEYKVLCRSFNVAAPGDIVQWAFLFVENFVGNGEDLNIRQIVAVLEMNVRKAFRSAVVFDQPL